MSDLERALQLKEDLIDFVYDASGAIAVALETFAADKAKKNSYGIKQQNLTVDLFLTQGQVEGKTPIELFLEQSKLAPADKSLVEQWQRNFIGLFEIKSIEDDSYQLMNWLTAKTYQVSGHSALSDKETSRWQPGEIILTILAPINEREWFFFSDRVIKGRLSQPKLAVAVGEFRDNYPESLYADAPELLAQAWSSVAVYHHEFVDYLGSDRITLPGYKLNQKIGELQQMMSQKKLAEAGIDDSKSLSELIEETGPNRGGIYRGCDGFRCGCRSGCQDYAKQKQIDGNAQGRFTSRNQTGRIGNGVFPSPSGDRCFYLPTKNLPLF